jgi:DivIVA domain-containing protein
MSETSLLANVEFDTVKKGYDPEQVDNYLHLLAEKVGQLQDMARHAVEQAELAQARQAEAERSTATAQAEVEQARGDLVQVRAERTAASTPPATDESEEGTEALKKMLMLAQRTADNHVEEAQASAKNIVADARTKSAEIVAGAETRAERLLIEAQKIADELVQERSANITSTITELEQRRDDLQVDVEVLSQYLSEHRGRLQAGVETLRSLLDDPRKFRAEAVPELTAELGSSLPSAPAPNRPTEPLQADPPSSVRTSPTNTPTADRARDTGSRDGGDGGAPGGPRVVRVGNRPGAAASSAARVEPDSDFPAVKIPDLLETPPELGDPPTQQISASDQQSLLAEGGAESLPPLDPSTDEAARKFFEDDFD